MTIPKGGNKNIPAIIPTVQPITPYLEPPNLLVVKGGIRKSSKVTTAIIAAHINRNLEEKGDLSVSWRNIRARNASGGPGITGRKHPAIPPIRNNTPRIINTTSTVSINSLLR